MTDQAVHLALRRPVDPGRDHLRWGGAGRSSVTLLIYGDYLCPYCRSIRGVIKRLRTALGDRLTYVFRQFPNERAHPGAEFASRAAEAAGLQGRFWEMHDALYDREPPLTREHVLDAAMSAGLDMERFARDIDDPAVAARVDDDLADGRRNGVSGTPTIFVDGQRYDGAWDLYSMLEALDRPVGARVQRTARAFANLPASAGLVLIIAAAAALLCVNTPLGGLYQRVVDARLGVGVTGGLLSLSVGEWCSEGLLTLFFLLVGLEIRREMTVGAFTDRRAAVLPIVCAFGGVLAPALIYLTFNPGRTAPGWSAPTSTGIAFALGILAVLGPRVPIGLKVFVAALAVVDDIISMLTLAIFYPTGFEAGWMAAAAANVAVMVALNRWRVYAGWPYLVVTIALWLSLHAAGVSAALAGVVLAVFLPTRPAPAAGPLLAQVGYRPGRPRSRPDGGRGGVDRVRTHLGVGQPQPLGRRRPAAFPRRPRGARHRALVGLCDPASVRLLRDWNRAGRGHGLARRAQRLAGRRVGPGHRQAPRRGAGRPCRGEVQDRRLAQR